MTNPPSTPTPGACSGAAVVSEGNIVESRVVRATKAVKRAFGNQGIHIAWELARATAKGILEADAPEIAAAYERGKAEGLQEALSGMPTIIRWVYNEGFSEGTREHTTSRGGKPFSDSDAKRRADEIDARLAALRSADKKGGEA